MKRFGTLFMAIVCVLGVADAQTDYMYSVKNVGNTFYFDTVLGGLSVIRFDSIDSLGNNVYVRKMRKNVVVPDMLEHVASAKTGNDTTYKVVEIADEAFRDCIKIQNVRVPATVETIGTNAFANCIKLERIHLEYGLYTLRANAFVGCEKLDSVVLPNSISSWGQETFSGCKGLHNVVVPTGMVSLPQGTFMDCDSLDSVRVEGYVRYIREKAFYNCKSLKKIYWGNNIEHIFSNAFTSCALDTLVLPSSLKKVDTFAFFNSGVQVLMFDNPACTLSTRSFFNCKKLKEVNIPASIAVIEGGVFDGCSALEKMIVDEDNPQYDSRNNCNAIIHTGTGILMVGCKNTEIPGDILGIGPYALSGCFELKGSVLESLALSDSIIYIGEYALSNNYFSQVKFPSKLKELPRGVMHNCWVKEVIMPDSLEVIGPRAFESCSPLDTVVLPAATDTIGDSAFMNCQGMSKFSAGDSLSYIGNYAFHNCASLKYVNLEKCRLHDIGDYAFYNCFSLSSNIDIGNSLRTLGSLAFYNCAGFNKDYILPETLWKIGAGAFAGCNKIDTLHFMRKVPAIVDGDLGISLHTVIRIPCGTYYDYLSVWGMYSMNLTKMQETPPASYTVTVYVDSVHHGTAEVVPQGFHMLGCDTSAILLATPKKGWLFYRWNHSSRQNPDTLWINGDAEAQAFFVPDATPSLCKVSVEDGYNTVSWVQDNKVNNFFIYRYSATTDRMERVDTIMIEEIEGYHRWVDTVADPSTGPSTYAVQAVELHGVETYLAGPHSTMYLTVQPGYEGRRVLRWNAYVGMFTSGYYVYRGSSPDSLSFVGAVPAKDGDSSLYAYYVDSSAVNGPVYYQVAVRMLNRCTPGEEEEFSHSNVVAYGDVGIDDVEPVSLGLAVSVVGGCIHVRGAEGRRTAVYDMMGRQVATELPTAPLPRGVYLVRVEGLPAVKAVVMR